MVEEFCRVVGVLGFQIKKKKTQNTWKIFLISFIKYMSKVY